MERTATRAEESPVLTEFKKKWEIEQKELKKHCVLKDVYPWQVNRLSASSEDQDVDSGGEDANIVLRCLRWWSQSKQRDMPVSLVAGTDISFVKGDDVTACASLVVIELPRCEVVYEHTSLVEMSVPYIPGFLAFREAPHFIEKFAYLKEKHPELYPQVVLVDGNGLLHTKEFGLACHLGVQLDIPTVGVAKTLFHVDGLEKNEEHQRKVQTLKAGGDFFPLVGNSGKTYGVALRCHDSAPNPIYVSQGHKISLDAAIWLVKLCSLYRIPEPTRQADIKSRQFLRELEQKKTKDATNS